MAKATKLKPYADFQTLAKDRAGTVQALAAARFDWEQALRDLSRAMPEEVVLSSLDGTSAATAAPAAAHSAARSSRPPSSSRAARRASRRSPRLMSRMRNVQGVTRVTLAKSDKDGPPAHSAPRRRHRRTVNPCGKGSPPAFEMVIFFERSAVAAGALRRHRRVDPPRRHAPATARRRRKRARPPARPSAAPRPPHQRPRPPHRDGRDRRYPVSRRNSMLLAARRRSRARRRATGCSSSRRSASEAAKLAKSIATKQGEVQAAEAQLATYEKAKAGYKANYALVARLGKAVPADDDVRSLMVQLDAAAGKSKVDFRTIQVGEAPPLPRLRLRPERRHAAGDARGTGATPPPGATPVGTAGFSPMPFTFAFRGSFFSLGEFFNRLDRFVAVKQQRLDVTGRLMVLNSISLKPGRRRASRSISAQIERQRLPAARRRRASRRARARSAPAPPPAPRRGRSPPPAPSSSAPTTTAAIGATR